MADSELHPVSHAVFGTIAAWLRREGASRREPLLVGIGGPGGCGKSSLTHYLREELPGSGVLSLDDFRLPRAERATRRQYGSHPDGNDLVALRSAVAAARRGEAVPQPLFDTRTGTHAEPRLLEPASLFLFDGEIAAHTEIRSLWNRLILVDAHWRTQLNTRLTRDIRQRGSSLEKAIDVFLQSNLRDYPRFAVGVEERADIILYRNARHIFGLRKAPWLPCKKTRKHPQDC